jgi:hypothetical protein
MSRTKTVVAGAAATALAGIFALSAGGAANAGTDAINFRMVRSSAAVATGCLPNAKAIVHVEHRDQNERMVISASGLPRNREFDLFVIQQPNAPFGLSWYQSDLQTDKWGNGHVTVVGRFNIETFAVAPGTLPAPTPHGDLDANSNPATKPIHTFHLGLWFNSPKAAAAAGCGDAVTPFNGDHTAGVQVLSTRQFDALQGPLSQLGS